jgi:hypothetical protein
MLIAVHLPVHHRTFITGCRTSRRVGPIEVADPLETLGPTLTAQLEQFVIEVAALLASLVGDGLGGGLAQVPQTDSVFRLHRQAVQWR